jgi:hypothetical protein
LEVRPGSQSPREEAHEEAREEAFEKAEICSKKGGEEDMHPDLKEIEEADPLDPDSTAFSKAERRLFIAHAKKRCKNGAILAQWLKEYEEHANTSLGRVDGFDEWKVDREDCIEAGVAPVLEGPWTCCCTVKNETRYLECDNCGAEDPRAETHIKHTWALLSQHAVSLNWGLLLSIISCTLTEHIHYGPWEDTT